MRINFWTMSALSVVVIGALILAMRSGGDQRPATGAANKPATDGGDKATPADGEPLMVYCAAGLKKAVDAAVADYQQEFNTKVDLQFNGSNTLLSTIELAKKGDLFIAADDIYLQQGRERQLVDEIVPIAEQQAVLAVKRGNPLQVTGLESFNNPALRIGLASEQAAVGLVSRQILEHAGLWETLKPRVLVFKPTVSDLANDLKLGVIDVAIVWDATAAQYPELEAMTIESSVNTPQPISAGVLRSSTNPTRALHLARYLGAPDRGQKHFKQSQYTTVPGDPWAEKPELVFFSGGVMRPGVEKTLAEFAAREGVTINTSYNGCGILVGMMKTGQHPDAYFACDSSFMNSVGDLFTEVHDVSRTEIVLAVPKNNPRAIKGLEDLTATGLKLGMCNPEQSALGNLTKKMLEAAGMWDRIAPQVAVQTPTADLLVAQLSTGALDAAIVFRSNLAKQKETLAEVALDGPGRVAVQPVALARDSKYPQLTARLIDAIVSARSKELFLDSGFEWIGTPAATSAAAEATPAPAAPVGP